MGPMSTARDKSISTLLAVRTGHGVDTLCPVTSKLVHLARRASVSSSSPEALVAAGGPAGADVPESLGRPQSELVDPWHAVWLLVGIPLLLFVVITAIVIIPGVVRASGSRQGRPGHGRPVVLAA